MHYRRSDLVVPVSDRIWHDRRERRLVLRSFSFPTGRQRRPFFHLPGGFVSLRFLRWLNPDKCLPLTSLIR
jgi:hypothetical protein